MPSREGKGASWPRAVRGTEVLSCLGEQTGKGVVPGLSDRRTLSPQCNPPTAHLAISGSDHWMHLSVFFIMVEFCSRKKGRSRRRTRRCCGTPQSHTGVRPRSCSPGRSLPMSTHNRV